MKPEIRKPDFQQVVPVAPLPEPKQAAVPKQELRRTVINMKQFHAGREAQVAAMPALPRLLPDIDVEARYLEMLRQAEQIAAIEGRDN